eukprot:587772-Hanusia_phi.AAC.1
MSRIHHGAARDLKDFDNDAMMVRSHCQAFTRRPRPSVRRRAWQTPAPRRLRSAAQPGRGRARPCRDSEPDHPCRPDRTVRLSDHRMASDRPQLAGCQGSVDGQARPDHSTRPAPGRGRAAAAPKSVGWHPPMIGSDRRPRARRGRPATCQVGKHE